MHQRFINNFATLVGATFGISDTQLTLASTTGLPVLSAGEYFLLTLYRQVGVEESGHEVVKVTSWLGNIATISARAIEGAAPSQFLAGDRVQARVTAMSLQDKADQVDMTAVQATLATHTTEISSKASQTSLDVLATTVSGKAAQDDLLTLQDTVNLKMASTDVATAITQAKSDVKAEILGAAPAALDTLVEFSNALGADPNYAATTATSLGNRLRVDAAQGLTAPQQAQGRSNLGLAAVASSGAKADVGLGNVDNTSDANKPVSTAQAAALGLKQDTSTKDASGGYAGLTLYKINFKNSANTATSFFTNANTMARTYSFQDRSGTIADNTDLALKANLTTNTFTGAQIFSDQQLSRAMLSDVGHVFIDKGNSGTATQTLDFSAGSHQKVTATGNHTWAISNWPPTGNTGFLMFEMVNFGAFTTTPPTINWQLPAGGFTTSMSTYLAALAVVGGRSALATSGKDFAILWSSDAGTTVYGKLI